MRATYALTLALVLAGLSGPADAVDYTWDGSTGPWTDAARWTPAGGPPASASDTGTMSAGTAQAAANLGTAGNQPTIQVNGTGKVRLEANTSGHTFVLDSGKITMNNPGRFANRTSTDTVRVQNTGTLEANGDTSLFYVNGLIQDGTAAGKVLITSLVPTGGGACHVAFNGTAPNTYTGGTQIDVGGLHAYRAGCLGTGDVLVKGGAVLRIGAVGVTAPAARITVQGNGTLQLGDATGGFQSMFNCSGHTVELQDGAQVSLVQSGRRGSCTTLDTFLTVGGTASFRIANDSGSFYLDGPIRNGTSAGKIWYRTQNVVIDGAYYVRAANSYTGGTEIEDGASVYVRNAAGLSTGPVKVSTGGTLYLDLPANANWNLANDLAGAATIQVEDGSTGYTLTAAGSSISPGNSASTAGTLTIGGNLAFARNGSTPVTLNIDVFGSGSPVVVSNDQLAVTRSVSGLSNVALNVSISGASYQDLAGKTLPILTCTNSLAGQAFSSVTYPSGWTGVLTYGNGSVTLQLQASQAAPPSTITDLTAGSATASTVTLSWTAPGAHGTTGTATSYDIRYSTAAITDANWDSAIQVTGEPVPQAYGTPQSMVVTGLTPDMTYFFAIKALNDTPATSALSNVPSAITRVSDDAIAPAAIADLAASYPGSTHLILIWTAPGDDANTGTASSYDIRYSTSPITNANWAGATPVLGEPAPAAAGTMQSMNITGLLPGTDYYFAIKTADEVPNWSALSNVAMAHTRSASSDVIPPAAVTNLAGGWPSGSSIDVSWTAPGDDGSFGTAAVYDVRYSKSPINDANWDSATRITNVPVPAAAGTGQTVTVIGLDNNTTYYFALKTADEDYNWSPLSNIASYATTGPDVTGPAQVTDLAISDVAATSVRLTWTVTGNDGMLNLAAVNDIRYSTAPITSESWFYTAAKATGEPVPALPGTAQSMTVSGLNEGTTYYFAIRVVDPYMNWSSLSNVPSAATLSAADATAPAAITNLVAGHPSSGTIRLDWTAPGDDGNSGTAATYEIRFATSAITGASWSSARQVSGVLAPQVAGTKQTWTVYGLSPSTPYYFAMKTVDEAGNRSALSNVATATTLTSSALNRPVLTRQDFEYLGAFKLPYSNFGQSNAYTDTGIAIRHVNGNIQILTGGHRYTGDAIFECTFPGWGSDSSTWPQATTIREWGTAVYDYPRVKPNITGQTWTHGVMFDEATGRFYFSWGPWYNIPPSNHPSLGYAVLNDSGPVVHGPWAGPSPDAHCQKIRGGSLIIPDWFATDYLGGRKLGLGFGGYYSGWSGAESARGTFLAAAHHPDDSTAQLDTINLIDHTLAHWGPRDADYWSNTVSNPVGNIGYWAFADTLSGGAVWIDLPDKHGLLYLSIMGHGNIPYIHSAIYPERQEGHWWIYDPKDLAAVAQGTQQPWDPQADSWLVQYNPRPGGSFDTPGCAFDRQTRTLFVLVTGSYEYGANYWHPLVHGFRIKETPPIRLVGDINNDGYVNVGDLQALVAAWGSQKTPPSANWNADADINADGFVNVGDLQLLVAHWGEHL